MINTQAARPNLRNQRDQFTLLTLFKVVVVVSCGLAVNRWLGPTFGWATAIPLMLALIVGMQTGGWTMVGTLIGCLLTMHFVTGGIPADSVFREIEIGMCTCGASAGAGTHAILLRRWFLGLSR